MVSVVSLQMVYSVMSRWSVIVTRLQVQAAENSPAVESIQRQLTETVDKLHRTEQLLADAQKVIKNVG